MIRPWYRSRLFWLGVPGLVFLVWAWDDSSRSASGLFYKKHQSWIELSQGRGLVEFSFGKEDGLPGVTVDPDGWNFFRSSWNQSSAMDNPGEPHFPVQGPFWIHRTHLEYFHLTKWLMAHWLIIILYCIIWLSATLIWQRRKCRRLKDASVNQTNQST